MLAEFSLPLFYKIYTYPFFINFCLEFVYIYNFINIIFFGKKSKTWVQNILYAHICIRVRKNTMALLQTLLFLSEKLWRRDSSMMQKTLPTYIVKMG